MNYIIPAGKITGHEPVQIYCSMAAHSCDCDLISPSILYHMGGGTITEKKKKVWWCGIGTII